MTELYDRIGHGYATHRRPDPRIAVAIHDALGTARTVLNVGAGAGSYEPADRDVVAVEPAALMVAQRPPGSAPAVRARAESLPFADGAFDAVMGVLTLHHWTDARHGLAECRRVARERVVLLTWDPASGDFWLVRDYFPDLLAADRPRFPPIDALLDALGGGGVRPLPIPADCVDGFLGAYWRRPAAYLDADVRRGISSFARLTDVDAPLARLRDDLASGAWRRRNGMLLDLDELDLGYRLVVAAR